MDKTIKTLTEVLQESKKEGTSPYDTTAEVVRIEGKTAWVHIPGGIDETPVSMTIDARAGDIVQVRVSGGRAWITGNQSAPPTDDKVAKEARAKANSAEVIAVEASELSESAKTQAEAAARVAGNTSQHFWFTGTGLDTGAHITEKTEEEFISDPSNGGGNLLARSNGVAVRDGLNELATFYVDNLGRTILDLLEDNHGRIAAAYYGSNLDDTEITFYARNENGDKASLNLNAWENSPSVGIVAGSKSIGANINGIYLDGGDVHVRDGDLHIRDGVVYLANAKYIFSDNSTNTARNILGINSSNQLILGYGLYANNEGTTYVEGNNVQILSKNDVKASNAGGTAHCVGTMDTMTTTQHSTSTGSVAATTDSGDKTATFTKSGYYPLGIVGVNMGGTNRMYQNIYEYRLSARSSGSATLTYRFRNNSSAAFSGTFYVDILWIKI